MNNNTSEPISRPTRQKSRIILVIILLSIVILSYYWIRMQSASSAPRGFQGLINDINLIPMIIIFSITILIYRGINAAGFGAPSSEYARLEKWITTRIGRIDRSESAGSLKTKLEHLYHEEKGRAKDVKKLSGFKQYIDNSAYRHLLK